MIHSHTCGKTVIISHMEKRFDVDCTFVNRNVGEDMVSLSPMASCLFVFLDFIFYCLSFLFFKIED